MLEIQLLTRLRYLDISALFSSSEIRRLLCNFVVVFRPFKDQRVLYLENFKLFAEALRSEVCVDIKRKGPALQHLVDLWMLGGIPDNIVHIRSKCISRVFSFYIDLHLGSGIELLLCI